MTKFLVVFLVLALGCSAAGDGGPDAAEVDGLDADLAPTVLPAPWVAPTDPVEALVLSPDPALVDAVQAAAARYADRGFAIDVRDGGVPVRLTTKDLHGQARALSSVWCFGALCNSGHDTRVWVSEYTAPAMLRNVLDHEIAHILSGWGACVAGGELDMADDMHLVAGNVVSNGNTGYADFTWTAADQALVESCYPAAD